MRAKAIATEVWRNLAGGTSRAAVLCLLFTFAVGGVAAADVMVVSGAVSSAASYRAAGAGVQTVRATDGIDGRRCDALNSSKPIRAAGALRGGQPLHAMNLPGSELTTWEVTTGLLVVLPQIAEVEQVTGGGLWISRDLADTLGVNPGGTLATDKGDAAVAAVFEWPEDGRARDLGYSILAPVAADGKFSQCWANIWPQSDAAQELLYLPIDATIDRSQVEFGQLNASLGRVSDARMQVDGRLTRRAGLLTTVLGGLLGFAAVRARRLEIASTLHAGVRRVDLLRQHAGESLGWAVPGFLFGMAVIACQGYLAGGSSRGAMVLIGLADMTPGLAGVLIGTLFTVGMCRERHLFRLFKER